MPLRPTRSLAVFLAVVGLFFTVSILDSNLQRYSHGRLSIITAPKHQGSAPSPPIVDFWADFAELFDKAKPQIRPIELKQELQGEDLETSDEANGDRKPFHKSIGLPGETIKSLAQSHLKLITHTAFDQVNDHVKDLYRGTGIVTVAGGPYFAPAIVGIRMLRKTNSTLPVHVFLQSQSEYEREVCEDILPSLNAQCFVIEDHLRKTNPFHVNSYQLKVLAMLFSTFEKVLFLDSDCFPLRDPKELFTSEPFKSKGFLSWPDYWIATEDPSFYTIAGLAKFPQGVPARSSETGQMMIDKSKHLSSLLLAAYYNIFGPDFYYPLMSQGAAGMGDKETFLASVVVLGKPYYRTKEHVGTIGYVDPNGDFHGGAMVQYHAGDEYIFLHGNGSEKAKLPFQKPRPFFLHANVPKMNVAHLLDDNDIFLPDTDQRIRLWGEKSSTIPMFGYDIEKVVWDEMRHMACEMDTTLADFRGKWKICERANKHYKELFDNKAVDVPEGHLKGAWG